MRRRREELNRPVVEALTELEETASLGSTSLAAHEATLLRRLDDLYEVYKGLGEHYAAHHVVAAPRADRAKTHRPVEHPTHDALALAAEREDSARMAANLALKAAKLEKSRLEAYKADVQRAMLARTQRQLHFRRVDAQGTTFKAWNKEELKLGGGGGE